MTAVPTATATLAVPTAAEQAPVVLELPTTGVDPGRSLGLALLTVLAGALALAAIGVRSSTRASRASRARS